MNPVGQGARRSGMVILAATLAMSASALAWTGGATVTERAARGTPFQATDTIPRPVPRRVVLVSDSVLAGIRTNGHLDRLTGANWDPHLASCRRLVAPSCRIGANPAPPTALAEIAGHASRHGAADPSDVLVIGTGYNDAPDRFLADFGAVVDEARRAGFERIVWLTYRTGVRSDYERMNATLLAAVAGGGFPDVTVWDYGAFTAGRSEWFAGDGLHLSSAGAAAIADWLSSFVAG